MGSSAGTTVRTGNPFTPDISAASSGAERRPSRRLRIALWSAVALLTVVGVLSAILRMSIVATTLATPPEQRQALSTIDQLSLKLVAAGLRVTAGTPAYARVQSDVVRFANEYTAHPAYTLMHLVPGALILLLAPFQFSRQLRARHIRFHRWSGRFILAASIAIVVSGLFFGVVRSSIHPTERPTIVIIMGLFVLSATRAYVAIRRKDVARHREWMIRSYAVLIGIATVRVVALPMPLFFRGSELGVAVIVSWWLGWLLTLAAAEVWIRHSRRTGVAAAAVAF